ncbi:MAG: M24 family metallopeptidase [Pseudobdellovibrionaceae bacterium]
MKTNNSLYLQTRRNQLAKNLKNGLLVLSSSGAKVVKSHFYYLTQMEASQDFIILGVENGVLKEQLYFRKSRTNREIIWDGAELNDQGVRDTLQGLELRTHLQFQEALVDLISKYTTFWTCLGDQNDFDQELLKLLRQTKRNIFFEVCDVSSELSKLRMIKEDLEVEKIRKACQISVHAHKHLRQQFKHGGTELQMAAHFDWQVKMQRAEALAYNTILAAGKNSTYLHHEPSQDELRNDELVLVDAGAQCDHYCADITRTYPISGKFTQIQKEVYAVVLEAQKEALRAIHPGTTLAKIHDAAHRVIADFAKSKNVEVADIFPHKTSHWLGLDVHDAGIYEEKLRAGMVFTVEPGIYFHPFLTKKNEKYEGIGIRIEDEVLITETGYEVLTDGLAKDIV